MGSVGNPLDITQDSYAIVEGKFNDKDQSSFTIALVRVPYDIDLAIKQVELTDMPEKKEYINELKTAIYRERKN